MRCLMSLFGVLVSIVLLCGARADAVPNGCPGDIRAALAQACPCDAGKDHGHYMKCIRTQLKQLKKDGCEKKPIERAAKCANASTCGKAHNPVVCCTKRGRAKLTSEKKCTAHAGRVMSGVNSLCDAGCGTP